MQLVGDGLGLIGVCGVEGGDVLRPVGKGLVTGVHKGVSGASGVVDHRVEVGTLLLGGAARWAATFVGERDGWEARLNDVVVTPKGVLQDFKQSRLQQLP